MSNGSKSTPKAARKPRETQKQRPLGELKFTVMIRPPDGERDAENVPIPVEVDVDLRRFSLLERQLVKTIMNKFAAPVDMEDVVVAHAWIVWRRTHPDSSLQYWMEHIDVGDLMECIAMDPKETNWDTTPEDFDPKAAALR
jgi:hypothetical protein